MCDFHMLTIRRTLTNYSIVVMCIIYMSLTMCELEIEFYM